MPAAIEMPLYISSKVFDLNHAQQITPTGENGFIQTLQRSSPFWMAEYETPGLAEDRYQEWINFFDLLEGSMNTFLAYDPRRPMPYAYRSMSTASDPWTQSGQPAPRITGQNYANSTIDLDRMENGAIITKSDLISVQVGGIWYLFRSQENRTAAANAVTALVVKPRPNIASLVATSIRYRKACCEMKMIGKQQERDSVEGLPSFSFRGGQYSARVPT